MKPRFFALFAILMLVTTGVIAAQEADVPEAQGDQNPQTETPEKTGISTVDMDVQGTMSMKGTVVNASPEEVIVETEDGREVFLLDSEDLYSEPIAEGTPVEVWFVERADRYYATRLEVGDGEFGLDRLPQTASMQPLLALLGLAALACATALWRLRRS